MRVFTSSKSVYWLILFWLFMLLLPTLIFSKPEPLKIWQGDKMIGVMSVEQFQAQVSGAERTQKEIDAEQNNRVIITILDTPYKMDGVDQYSVQFEISWIDKNNIAFKTIKMKSIVVINKDKPISEFRMVYRDVAEIGFPVSGGLLILILIILL